MLRVEKSILLFIWLFLLVALPGAMINAGNAGSMALGLILANCFALLAVMVYFKTLYFSRLFLAISWSVIAIIIINYIATSNFYNEAVSSRFIFSLVALVFLILTTAVMVVFSKKISANDFDRVVNLVYFLLIGNAFISIPFIYLNLVHRKSMFIFSEPSHFAIAIAPFLLYKMMTSSRLYGHVIVVLLLVMLLQNLTLMIVALFCFIISINFSKISLLFSTVIVISITKIMYYLYSDFLSYFIDRLYISDQSDNLSVLVLLSGYERAYLGFSENYGLGVGFQNMGLIGPLGSIQEKMASLNAEGLNLLDGSTLISKIVIEFGVIGLLAVFLYVVGMINKIKMLKSNCKIIGQDLFYNSCFVTFSIVVFVRGPGYFSPSFFLFVASIYWFVNPLRDKVIRVS